jgi:uncharacterized protein
MAVPEPIVQDPPTVPVGLVDTDVHPLPRCAEELHDHLAEPWRSRPAQAFVDPKIYYPWGGGFRTDAVPETGPPGSDPELTERQLFDEAGVDIAMLLPIVRPHVNPYLEAALHAATNDWIASTWLGSYNGHGRYRAAINVGADLPERAVAEIERWAGHPYFAQVRINTYTEAPFGDERYHPIYAAAARHRLPVSVHFAKSSGVALATPVGFQRSYFEVHSLLCLDYAAQLVSLIAEGVFERIPGLRFVFIEGGFSWVLPLLWRMDQAFAGLRDEVPWVRRRPSEYVRDHVRFTTQPIEEPDRVADLLRTYELVGADDILMFSTDYPHWDFDTPRQASFDRLPAATRENIFFRTALDTYRLPATRPAVGGRR